MNESIAGRWNGSGTRVLEKKKKGTDLLGQVLSAEWDPRPVTGPEVMQV